MSWIQYDFYVPEGNDREFLMAILSDEGAEGFEEFTDVFKAYVAKNVLPKIKVIELLHDHHLSIPFESIELEEINWNAEWEKNFQPVLIAERVGIRAPFHEKMNAEIELVIEPKMSFGTGHHQTTSLMIEMMLNHDLKQKSILDFGSGTGVLAILAAKLQAKKIVAIDNEKWAYENAQENCTRNDCQFVEHILGTELESAPASFDFLLANINRNVILKNLVKWNTHLASNAVILLSGILLSDEKDIIDEAKKNGLSYKTKLEKDGWLCLQFVKK